MAWGSSFQGTENEILNQENSYLVQLFLCVMAGDPEAQSQASPERLQDLRQEYEWRPTHLMCNI